MGRVYSQDNEGIIDQIIVKINDEIILESEFIERYLASQQEQREQTRCDVIRSLMNERVLSTYAVLDSLPFDESELENNLKQRVSFVVAQVGGESQVKALYGKSVRQLEDELRGPLRQQLLAERMQRHIISGADITPQEVESFFLSIPLSERPYYSMEVQVGQITRKVKAGARTKKQAYREALELRERILEGDLFERLARSYSMDPSVQGNNGELGFYKFGELDPEYEAAALSLQIGEISMPVLSQFGYHIIQLLEIKGNTYNTRHILIRPRISRADVLKEQLFLDSIREEILKNNIAFDLAARTHSDDPSTSYNGGFFSSNEGSLNVPIDQLDPLLFFSLDSMEVGNISPPLSFRSDQGEPFLRLLYYADRIPPHEMNYKQDYLKIYQSALLEKQEKTIKKWYSSAYHRLYLWIDDKYAHCEVYKEVMEQQ